MADDLVVTVLTKKKKTDRRQLRVGEIDRSKRLRWKKFLSMKNGRKRRALARELARTYRPDYFSRPEF